MNRKIIGNYFFGVEIKSTLMFFLDEVNADVGPLAGALQELYNGHSGGFATRLALASVFSFGDISGRFDGGGTQHLNSRSRHMGRT